VSRAELPDKSHLEHLYENARRYSDHHGRS
jgi:hypothetical protein